MRIFFCYLFSFCFLWHASSAAALVTEPGALIALQNILEFNVKKVSENKLGDWRMEGSGIVGSGITANSGGNLASLNISDKNLAGILTLHHMPWLAQVEAAYNEFSAVSCAALPRLRALNLKANKIRDLTPLADLKNLTALNLGHNLDITDVTPLAGLKDLEKLDLSLNQIRDIEALSSLGKLKELNLRANRIMDLTGIAFLRELRNLDISFNEIPDISVLGNFQNLEHLAMGNNPVSNLNPLRLLPNLKTLECRAIRNPELHVLYALKNLEKLHLEGNSLQDISVLAALTNLKEVNLANNQIRDIHSLRHATGMEYLNIAQNPLADISTLPLLNNLKTLSMHETNIADLHQLESLVNLENLQLGKNGLSNIAPLNVLTHLKRLDLSNNTIRDIAPLARLVFLESLDLGNNQIVRIDSLKNLQNLSRLVLDNNKIRNAEILIEKLEAENRQGKLGILRMNNNRLPLSQMYKLGKTVPWEGNQDEVYFFLRLQYLPICNHFDIPPEDLEINGIQSEISLEYDFEPGMDIIGLGRVAFKGAGYGKIVLTNREIPGPEDGEAPQTRSGIIHSLAYLPDMDQIRGLREDEKKILKKIYDELKTRGFVEVHDEDRNAELDIISRFLIKS